MTEREIRDLFGYNLKRLRKLRKVSQMQFADSVNMAFTFISDIENSRKWVSPESIAKFATALGVEPYHFFLPKDYELKPDGIASFAAELEDSFKIIKSRYGI